MQGEQHNFPRNQDQMGSFFGQNVDFHPSWDCPRNFIIFDRTHNCSQIMYNPGLNMGASYCPDTMQKDANVPRVMEEDSADIDALLSFDDEDEDEDEECEEDEVSTARTDGNDICDTSDSLRPINRWVGSTSSNGSRVNLGKREKMKRMVKSLKKIVPGGNAQMNTVDVLDEAVKYLKSLKVEAHKMGFGNLSG